VSDWIALDRALKGREFAVKQERLRIIERIRAQICFDALADADNRCNNHSGKCYELGLLIKELEETK
jgi:hypothetical protein